MAQEADWRSVLSDIAGRIGYSCGKSDVFSKIRASWSDIVGDGVLTRFCMPEYYEDGVLGVKANSAAAAMQFAAKKEYVLDNIRKAFPSCGIKNIIVAR